MIAVELRGVKYIDIDIDIDIYSLFIYGTCSTTVSDTC